MKQYKYFFISDLNKEAIGKFQAADIHSARKISCRTKKI